MYESGAKYCKVLNKQISMLLYQKQISMVKAFIHEVSNIYKISRLKYRRENHLLNYMYDQAQNQCLLKPKSGIITRSHNKKLLKLKRPYTEKFKKSVAYLGPKKWNSLPEQFHSILTKTHFKSMISSWVENRALGYGET